MNLLRSVVGVILCGGRGEALKPLSNYLQKAMLPVGSLEKPVLEYIIRHMVYHGITDIALLVSYKARQIINYFSDGSRFGAKIQYIHDSKELYGTGGALVNALQFINASTWVVQFGDILANVNLRDMMKYHVEQASDLTIAVATGYRVPVGVAEVEDEVVTGLLEKPRLEGSVVVGIFALKPAILEHFREAKGKLDFVGQVIPKIIDEGAEVHAYFFDGTWFDVGSSEEYEKLKPEDIDKLYSHLKLE